MMDILFIIPYVPNLIRVRPYNLIRGIAGLGHRVTLLTLWSDKHELDELSVLDPFCARIEAIPLPRWRSMENCLLALPSAIPLQAVYCWQPALAEKIRSLTMPRNGKPAFDVAHIEHLRGARYGLYLKSLGRGIPVAWDSVDCISLLFQRASASSRKWASRLLTRFELGRTRRYEGELVTQFDRTMVTSPADREALLALEGKDQSLAEKSRVMVLPNGVDLDYFKPHTPDRREPATLVISGKMSYHANITMTLDLVQSIMPYIWSKRPDVKLWIVGKDPPREIQALTENPSICVTGTVADIRPYLQQATVAVAPLKYGVGIQNKILEALACATAVVTTPQAISALSVEPGKEVLVAQEPEDFASQVLRLLEDSELRQRIGQIGHHYVEENHQWTTIAAHLEGAYHDLISTYAEYRKGSGPTNAG
jgi:polysaccharide biosynthesis protein PslH